jgi:hypothetical protein
MISQTAQSEIEKESHAFFATARGTTRYGVFRM